MQFDVGPLRASPFDIEIPPKIRQMRPEGAGKDMERVIEIVEREIEEEEGDRVERVGERGLRNHRECDRHGV